MEDKLPKKNKRVKWAKVKLKGNEAYLLSAYFTRLCSSHHMDFYSLLLSRLTTVCTPGLHTFAVGLDRDPETNRLRSHRMFFMWDPKVVRVIADCDDGVVDEKFETKDMRKMRHITAHEAHHFLLMHFSRLFDYLGTIDDPKIRHRAKKLFNHAADFEDNHRLVKFGYWNEVKESEWDPMPGLYAWDYQMNTDLTMEQYLTEFQKRFEQQPKQLAENLGICLPRGANPDDYEDEDDSEDGEGSDATGINGKQHGGRGEGEGQEGEDEGEGQEGEGQEGEGEGEGQEDEDGGGGAMDGEESENPNKPRRRRMALTREMIDQMSDGDVQSLIDDFLEKQRSMADGIDVENSSAEELSRMARDAYTKTVSVVSDTVKSYKNHQKSRGTLPSYVQELIENMLRHKPLSWKQILRTRLRTGCNLSKDWSNRAPNHNRVAIAQSCRRRGQKLNLCYFPGRSPAPAPKIYLIIDTSGSMSAHELERIYTEINAIVNEMGAELWVILCDVVVHAHFKCDSWRDLANIGFLGRGGTTMDAAFRMARKYKADMTVCYTDGYVPYPRVEDCPPLISCVWLLTECGVPPRADEGNPAFGTLLRVLPD